MDQTDSVITNINQIVNVPMNNADNLVNRGQKSGAKANNNNNNTLSNHSTVSADQTSTTAATATSKRPRDTALRQQRLPAWQPVLTAKTVLPLFFTVGVVFVTLGGVLLHYSDMVQEYVLDYTDCVSIDGSGKCSATNTTCVCSASIQLSKNFDAPVYLYYGLQNFYQNHRRYVKSRDDNQLLGNIGSLSSDCSPYDHPSGNSSYSYAPCGAIANSLFNGECLEKEYIFNCFFSSLTKQQPTTKMTNK